MTDLYPSRVAAEPQWLARKDPVIHSDWHSESPLSQAQHDAFERDGFLVLENVFEADEIAALQAEMNRLRGIPATLDADTIVAEPSSGALRSIFAVHQQSALLGRLAADERLVAIANHILGDEVYLHQTRLNYKPGFDGKEFYWHSDFETWHTEDGMPRMRAISASIMLTDNNEFNGPLMLIPGSHQYFVPCQGATPKDNWKDSLKSQRLGVPSQENLAELAERGGIQAPKGPPGSLLLFECNTLHASNKNLSPWPRSNLFFVYNSVDNTLEDPYCGHQPRPDFLANRENTEALAMHDHLDPL